MLKAFRHNAPAGSLLLVYLLLTCLYAYLGYLGHLDSRDTGVDGRYYYMYLRSLAFDADIDFSNEVLHYFGPRRVAETLTATGRTGNHWSIGPALFWAPFFGAAHVATLAASAIGARFPSDGYGGLYVLFVYIGNSLYGLAGFFLLSAAMRRRFNPAASLAAAAAVMLASAMTYYFWPFTTMPHAVSFFAVSLFVWSLLRFGIGWKTAVTAGLMFLARWQDILFVLLAIPEFGRLLSEAVRNKDFRPAEWLLRHALLAAVFLLVVSPQLAAWKILYGHWVTLPTSAQRIDFGHLHIFEVFFGTANGLILWHPLMALGFAGIGLLARKDRFLAAGLAVALLAQVVFTAAVQRDWGWSFGSRFLVGALPLLAFGLAACFEALGRLRGGRSLAGLLIIAFAVWNQLFVFQYQRGLIPRGEPLSLQEVFRDKWHVRQLAAAADAYRQARAALARNDFEEGLRQARQADALTGEKEKIVYLRAVCAFFSKRFDESRLCFERLIALKPGEPLYRVGVAYAYQALGQPQHAFEAVAGVEDADARRVQSFRSQGQFKFDARFFQRLFVKLGAFDGM